MTAKKQTRDESATRMGASVPGRTKEEGPESTGAFLVVTQHPSRGMMAQRIRLERGRNLSIGRSEGEDIFLGKEADDVSRRHAIVGLFEGDEAWIRDAGSTNGTFINGNRVGSEETRLQHGDFVSLGGTVHLKFLKDTENEELAYHDAIAALVHTDSLTGAVNASYFFDRLESEILRARRYERPLSLILFDVDRFKAVNDDYGHPAGDGALIHIVKAVGERCRLETVIARLGGDEFAVMSPETTGEDAARLAERLASRVATKKIETANGEKFSVSCSWGVAGLAAGMADFQALREAADQALYKAKEKGRDGVVLYEPEGESPEGEG